jgi:hypothetical protein
MVKNFFRVKRWNRLFAGKWCRMAYTNQTGGEGLVQRVTVDGLVLTQFLEVYPEIPPIRPREAVIEPTVMLVPFANILSVRVTPRETAEKFCRALNTTHIVNPRTARGN